MATTTVPTTIRPGALELARENGVERELYAILDKGREMLLGLKGFVVEAEPVTEMGDRRVVTRAIIDPAYDDDRSHVAWWHWRIEAFGIPVAERFLCTTAVEE